MPEIRDDYGAWLTAHVDEARLAGNLLAIRRRQAEHKVRKARIAASALTAVACALLGVVYLRITIPEIDASLQVASHEEAGCVAASAASCGESVSTFSDGSRVTRGHDTQLQLIENDGQHVRSVLHQGWARFSVKPGGSRRWLVDAGALHVEVIGTAFTVLHRGPFARVQVHHGRVIVRDEGAPGGSTLLTAGQSLSVGEPSLMAPSAEAAGAPATSLPAPLPPESALVQPAPEASPRHPAAPATRSRPSEGPARQHAELALVEADRLRLAGDAAGAHEVLARALVAEPYGPHAGVSAFTLAQLSLDVLGAPERAARELEQALASGSLSRSLQEQAMARLVEALARAGRPDDAWMARERYLAAYPGGRWVDAMVRWAPTK